MESSDQKITTSELIFSPDWRSVMLEEHCLVAQFDSELRVISCNANLRTILMCKVTNSKCEQYISFLDQSLNVIGMHMLRNVNRWKGKIRLQDNAGITYITNGTLQRFSSEEPSQIHYVLIMDTPEERFVRNFAAGKTASQVDVINFEPVFLSHNPAPTTSLQDSQVPELGLAEGDLEQAVYPEKFKDIISGIVHRNNISRSQSLIFSLESGIPLHLEPLNPSLNAIIFKSVYFSVQNTPYGIVAVHVSWNSSENELCVDIDDTGEPIKAGSRLNMAQSLQVLLTNIEEMSNLGHCAFTLSGRSSGNTLHIKARCNTVSNRLTSRQVKHIESKNRLVEDFLNDKMYRDEFKSNLSELLEELNAQNMNSNSLRKILHKTTPSLFYWNHNSAYSTARNLHEAIRNEEHPNTEHFRLLLTQEITTILASL